MARILITGVATRDIVNFVDHYPVEDEKMRAVTQEVRTGGNAANTANVLAQHGHEAQFLGNIAVDSSGDNLLETLQNSGINTHHCPRVPGTTPTSYITLNQQNGSRTIVHHRDLPELSATQFPIDAVSSTDWFHFEGRNAVETQKILNLVHNLKVDQGISVEIESPRENIESLFHQADVLLFSRAFAYTQGFDDPVKFLKSIRSQSEGNILACSWGEAGAAGMDKAGHIHEQSAWEPPRVVDTVAAGDVFNAGIIHAFTSSKSLPEALAYACELAGRKVGQSGLKNLIQP